MLALFAALALTPIAYQFPVEVKRDYSMAVGFDGYIPLMGGREAKVDVSMGLSVRGESPDSKGRPRVVSELTAVKILFNGTEMPFDLANVRAYFPKTTVSISPAGRVLETDAPNVVLPARLPGLDAKRFPEITYLPLEFPEAGVEVGKRWTFKRSLAGADATYTVKPTAITDEKIEMDVEIAQSSSAYEDAGHNPSEESGAAYRVETELAGQGKATFDRKLGLVSLFTGTTTARSTVADLKKPKTGIRKLTTNIKVELKRPDTSSDS